MRVYTIIGCIGAGKTTVGSQVAKELGCRFISENFEKNPFLEKYYQDMRTYAYQMQLWFLVNRFSQLVDHSLYNVVVQDQMLEAFGVIFPRMQFASGYMDEHDLFRLGYICKNLFLNTKMFSKGFDETIFYLQVKDVDKIMDRISERGRDCESVISKEYMEKLIIQYELWLKNRKDKCVLVDAFLPVDDIVQIITHHIGVKNETQ